MLNKQAIENQIEKKNIYVDNYQKNLTPNGIIVTLSNKLKVYEEPFISVKRENKVKEIIIPEEGLLLEPRKLYLGSTNEYTKTNNLVPIIKGLEHLSIGGMEVHVTAGFGDNGFEGTWTLEIICANPTLVKPNMQIGELLYINLVGNPNIKYKGKYLHQIEPTESRLNKEYKKVRK